MSRSGRLVATVGTALVACAATASFARRFRREAERAAAGEAAPASGGVAAPERRTPERRAPERRAPERRAPDISAHGAVTVRATPEQVYARWRDLPRLPSVLTHLSAVSVLDQQRSRWTAVGADNTAVTWDAEITEDVPGRELAWRSLPPARWRAQGRVRFSPARGGKGTEVSLDLSYSATRADAGPAPFAGADSKQIQRDLERFKRAVDAS
jgi:uncharacterized membrane protein